MSTPKSVRRSVIAGSWYPGSERRLTRTIQDYLERVDQDPVPAAPRGLRGLIVPHAGYTYSGQTAAYAYHQLQWWGAGTIVLLGPSHRAWVGDYALSAEDAYETPLGQVPLDAAFIDALEQHFSLQRVRRDAEHALEIQLPFLQHQLDDFSLVPILMSADDPAAARRLAAALAETIRQREDEDGQVLLLASSDLHHIEDYDEVVRRDRSVVEAVDAYDLERLTSLLMAPRSSVCGRMPILTALHAARELGADATKVLHQTNSGDVTGNRTTGQYTVGYMAAAIYKAQ